jgi:hypothetical protein
MSFGNSSFYNPANGWLQNCNSTPFSAAEIKESKKEETTFPYIWHPDRRKFQSNKYGFVFSQQREKELYSG